MTIEMYVLGLLKFEDGKIVFKEDELDKISNAIGECLKGKELVLPGTKSKRMDGWRVYSLDPKIFRKKVPTKVKIHTAELGYCHHRVIVHFGLGLKRGAKRGFSSERIMTEKEYPAFREARDLLKEETDKILNDCVKVKINSLVPEEVRKEGEAKFVYTYPLIVIKAKYKKRKMIPFSDETSTLCFEFVEPFWLPIFGKKHLMKVTIPSTILFTRKDVNEPLLRDIVNAIYRHCLYKKKAQDEKELEEIRKKVEEKIRKELKYPHAREEEIEEKVEEEMKQKEEKIFNKVMDEELLVEVWQHFLDTMGGKTADVYAAGITNTMRFLAFLTIIVTVLVFILSFIFEKVFFG